MPEPTPPTPTSSGAPGSQQAAELVRARLNELYQQYDHTQPQPTAQPSAPPGSLKERFWQHHSHRHPDPKVAWAQFYAELTDDEKHKLWQEYQEAAGAQPAPTQQHQTLAAPKPTADSETAESIAKLKERMVVTAKKRLAERPLSTRLRPWLTAFGIGGVVLTYNYNNLIMAQVKRYVSPGADLKTPIIIDPSANVPVTKDPRLIIPKINVDAEVNFDLTTYDEAKIQAALDQAVVHYGNTAYPGEAGNNVIIGHSSHVAWNNGKYKFVFVLLDKLEKGDTFIIHYKGTRYIYKVYDKYIVDPDDFRPIQPTNKPTTTLITCTPLGTNWRRLIIQAEQISPKPSKSKPKDVDSNDFKLLPGDVQTPLQRLQNWIFN